MVGAEHDPNNGGNVIMAARNGLRLARRKSGLTQLQLAVRVGICQQSMSKHERGLATPAEFSTIRKYERVLNTAADKLFPDIFSA